MTLDELADEVKSCLKQTSSNSPIVIDTGGQSSEDGFYTISDVVIENCVVCVMATPEIGADERNRTSIGS